MKNPTSASSYHSPLGTQVARAIMSGDVDFARQLARLRETRTWTVAEVRGIIGACKAANKRWNCSLEWGSFCW